MMYKVVSPYVTLRVLDEVLGQEVLVGFYAGAPLPEAVNREDLERHIRKGMVAAEGSPEADAVQPGGRPVEFDAAGMPIEPRPRPEGQPAPYASKGEWVEYAVSRRAEGVSEDDARAEALSKSKADLIAEHGK